jgi:hypothetical protein
LLAAHSLSVSSSSEFAESTGDSVVRELREVESRVNEKPRLEAMERFWFNATAALFALCAGFIGADAIRGAGDPHYSFWFCPLAFCGYVTAAVGGTSLVCELVIIWRRWRLRLRLGTEFADAGTPVGSERLLTERDLRDIRRINAASWLTQAQKHLLLAPYDGRKIRLIGTVLGVGEWKGSSSRVTVQTSIRKFIALMDFSDRRTFDLDLSILVPKRRLTVIGEIAEIEENSVLLRNCEIVSLL